MKNGRMKMKNRLPIDFFKRRFGKFLLHYCWLGFFRVGIITYQKTPPVNAMTAKATDHSSRVQSQKFMIRDLLVRFHAAPEITKSSGARNHQRYENYDGKCFA